jgi:hypothetical protein
LSRQAERATVPAPCTSALLDAWDAGQRATPTRRALLLLEAFREERTPQIESMPLGWISAELLRMRRSLFGPTLVCLTNCPHCAALVETTANVDDLLGEQGTGNTDPRARHSLRQDSYALEFRLPTAADLLSLRGEPASAARALAQSLVCSALQEQQQVAADDLPESVYTALEQAVVARDPLAHIELDIHCPGCSQHWLETLQVIAFIWAELGALAQRVIREVARLACAFGWSEQEILSLSEQRRSHYLALLPS